MKSEDVDALIENVRSVMLSKLVEISPALIEKEEFKSKSV